MREWKNVDMRKIKEGKTEYFVATFYSGGEKRKRKEILYDIALNVEKRRN